MKRSNRLVARSAVALSLAASLTACGTASSTTTTAVSSEAATETASETEAASTTENVGEDVWLPYNENLEKKRDDRDATGKNGAVASCNWYASKAGLEILKEGGNAFDAAAAVAYTLGVAEPYFSGLGGGGFMTIYSAKDDKVSVLDFRETAPAAANAQMWLDENGKMEQFSLDGVNNLGDCKTLILAVGGSSKGLGAAGIDADQELARTDALISAAKEKGIIVLALHTGGSARRGTLSDSFITPAFQGCDAAIVVSEGDSDGLMSGILSGNGTPAIYVDNTAGTLDALKTAFGL